MVGGITSCNHSAAGRSDGCTQEPVLGGSPRATYGFLLEAASLKGWCNTVGMHVHSRACAKHSTATTLGYGTFAWKLEMGAATIPPDLPGLISTGLPMGCVTYNQVLGAHGFVSSHPIGSFAPTNPLSLHIWVQTSTIALSVHAQRQLVIYDTEEPSPYITPLTDSLEPGPSSGPHRTLINHL